jgi:hypothetical protein
MSDIALGWANRQHPKTIAQRDVLRAMAEAADDTGAVYASQIASSPHVVGMTPLQVRKYAEALLSAGLASKSWDPDKYQWKYRLHVEVGA